MLTKLLMKKRLTISVKNKLNPEQTNVPLFSKPTNLLRKEKSIINRYSPLKLANPRTKTIS